MSTKSQGKKAEPSAELVGTATKRIEAKATKASRGRAKNDKPTPKANASSPGRSKLSALDAAAKVLESGGEPMRAGDLIEAMAKQRLWTSPGGMTPDATLSAAMNREIAVKGREARFKKIDRGLFAFAGRRR